MIAGGFLDGLMTVVVVIIAVVMVASKEFDRYSAHKEGRRSIYDEKCQFCGKRLKIQPGQVLSTHARMPVCHHCGREQTV